MSLSFNLSLPLAREAKGTECRTPADAAREFAGLATAAQECFCVLTLNTKYQVIDRHVISIGTLDSCLAHPREIFRPAITDGAAAVVLVHNHPSGETTPSREDIRLTRRLVECAQILDLELLDHVILGRAAHHHAGYLSIRESGMVSFAPEART